MNRLIVAMAAAAAIGCGGVSEVEPDAGSVEQDAGTVEPVTIDITGAVGSVPDSGGADYEVTVSARASRYSFCDVKIACDGVPLRAGDNMILPTTGTIVHFLYHDGVPVCAERTVEIVCPGGSAVSIWSAR